MDNKHEIRLLKVAKMLDIKLNFTSNFEELCCNLIGSYNTFIILEIFNKISYWVKVHKDDKTVLFLLRDLKDSIYYYCGYKEVKSAIKKNHTPNTIKTLEDNNLTLEELLSSLNELVGLERVKKEISGLISYQKVRQMRKEYGLSSGDKTLHMAFTGNPGTGKTTVARIVGRMYKQLGLLSKGHFIEASRTDLIAGYQGQTALKVSALIKQAKGGVLFIDEAYSITENDNCDSYGKECLTELTKALEDYRNDLVVIVAGYTEPMKHFFEANPGLKSRFNTYIEFDDYKKEELVDILNSMCEADDYIIDNSAMLEIDNYLSEIIAKKGKVFSNGRFVRNVYERLVMNHAKRVVKLTSFDTITLKKIIKDDVSVEVFNHKYM